MKSWTILGLCNSILRFGLPFHDRHQAAQRLVHGIVIWKVFRDIGIDDNDIRALCIAFSIFAATAAAEIALFQHVRIAVSHLHSRASNAPKLSQRIEIFLELRYVVVHGDAAATEQSMKSKAIHGC